MKQYFNYTSENPSLNNLTDSLANEFFGSVPMSERDIEITMTQVVYDKVKDDISKLTTLGFIKADSVTDEEVKDFKSDTFHFSNGGICKFIIK